MVQMIADVRSCDYTVVRCCSSQHRLPCDHGSKRSRYIGKKRKKVARLERLVLSFACSASSSWYVHVCSWYWKPLDVIWNHVLASLVLTWLEVAKKVRERLYNLLSFTVWMGQSILGMAVYLTSLPLTSCATSHCYQRLENNGTHIIVSYTILLGFAQHQTNQPHSLACGNYSAIELSLFARWSAWHPPQELQTLQLGLQKVLIVLAI
jgi:hypothetical protein